MTCRTRAFLPVAALAAACGDAAWTPSPVGPASSEDLDLDMAGVSLEGDTLEWAADETDPAGPGAALHADAPQIFYLFYADGTANPGTGRHICSATPPAYTCSFGGGAGVEGCKTKVQTYLDKWYGDFNLIFTLTRPAAAPYYTEIITASGGWCGMSGGVGGVAPFACGGLGGGTCYAFLCGSSAKSCAVIIAQEQAHLVGLAHTSSSGDVMYPSVCSACDGFQDKDNPVSGGMCRSTQNSFQLMKTRLGAWPGGSKPGPSGGGGPCTDAAPPTVTITQPTEGATVGADFTVKASAMDDCGLKDLRIDAGGLTATAMPPGPYEWALTGLAGPITVQVTATDAAGKTARAVVMVKAPGGGGGAGGAAPGSGGAGAAGGGSAGAPGGGAAGEGGGGPGPGAGPGEVAGGCAAGRSAGDARAAPAVLGLVIGLGLAGVGRRRRRSR